MTKDVFIILAVTTIDFPTEKTFMCIEEVLNDFWENYSYLPKFDSGKKLEIKEKLKRYVKMYNNQKDITQTERLMQSANEAKDVCLENLDKLWAM